MVFFVSAVIFHYTIHRKAVSSDTPPPNGKLVAGVSLFLWCGVIFSGIFIGFVYPGLSLGCHCRLGIACFFQFAQWIQLTRFFHCPARIGLRLSDRPVPAHGRHRPVRRNDPDDRPAAAGLDHAEADPIADVVNQFRVPKRWGLLLTVTCGILMFGSKAEEYYYNAFFRTKLILSGAVCIVIELVFYRSVYANPAALDQAPSAQATRSWRRRSRCCSGPPSPAAAAESAISSRRSTRSTPRST